jgi:hypothetical protein
MMSSYMLAARRCQHIEAGTPFLEYPELLDAVSSVRRAQISTMPSIFPRQTPVIGVPETTGAPPGRLHQNRASRCVLCSLSASIFFRPLVSTSL